MPPSGESRIIEWLTAQPLHPDSAASIKLGIGDDMASIGDPGSDVLITTDMLLDGVHFDLGSHDLESIGRKALACGLSDCAAMAVKPLAAAVSVALPRDWRLEDTHKLYRGIHTLADAFACPIIGGDTTAWDQRFAIDVTVLANPHPGHPPVRRDGAKANDILFVTGPLGGSRLGRHLTFTPRVHEARRMVCAWGDRLHAMLDISDGLALDLHRLCAASGVGAVLQESLLQDVISPDAREAAVGDARSPLQHALTDGEDFELLLAADPGVDHRSVEGVTLYPIGVVTPTGLTLHTSDGAATPLEPEGFEHLA